MYRIYEPPLRVQGRGRSLRIGFGTRDGEETSKTIFLRRRLRVQVVTGKKNGRIIGRGLWIENF